MSTIDERVVSLKFRGDQFKAGIKDAMSNLDTLKQKLNLDKVAASVQSGAAKANESLGRLKSGLNLDGATAGLERLATAGKNFTLDALGQSADAVRGKFTALDVMAVTALANISSRAVDAGLNLLKSFTVEPIMDGFREYETKLGSIQTILANTSKDGTTLKDVTASLNELNDYSDKTIYNFGDMTRNIGLFTNAGIGVKAATSMIKGFSNEAAASGTTSAGAAGAAYQLSQALSKGKVTLEDWRSLTNAGMGNKNMQNGLIEIATAMGAFTGTGTDATQTAKDFNGSLQKGWLTASVMEQYLRIQAGELTKEQMKGLGLTDQQIQAFIKQQKISEAAATKVRTLTQLIGTIRESIGSSWATSAELLLGDFDQATALFTGINDGLGPVIASFNDSRNRAIKQFVDAGGRDAIINTFKNLYTALAQILVPISQAWHKAFPPTAGKAIAGIAKAIEIMSAHLKIGADASKILGRVMTVVFAPLGIIFNVLSNVVRLTFAQFKFLFQILDAIGSIFAPLVKFIANFTLGLKGANLNADKITTNLINLEGKALKPLLDGIRKVGAAFDNFLNGKQSKALSNIQSKFAPVVKIFNDISAAITKVVQGDLSQIGPTFNSAIKPLIGFANEVKNRYETIRKAISDALPGVGQRTAEAWKNVTDFIKNAWDTGKSAAENLKNLFGNFTGLLGIIGDGIKHILGEFNFETVLAAINTGMLIGAGVLIKKFFSQFKGVGGGFKEAILGPLEGLTGVLESMEKRVKADILLRIAAAIAILAVSLVMVAMVDPSRLTGAVIAIGVLGVILGGLSIAMGKLLEGPLNNVGMLKLIALSTTLIIIAGAVLLLSIAIKRMSSLSWEELAKGLIGLAVGLTALSVSAAIIDSQSTNLTKTGLSLMLFAGAIGILALTVKMLGSLPWPILVQGMITLGILLAAVVTSAAVLSSAASQMSKAAIGMIAMAIAIQMLTGVVLLLGIIPWPILLKGLTNLAILIGLLVVAAGLLSAYAPQMSKAAGGMIAMAFAIDLLAAAVGIMGSMNPDTILKGLVAVGIAMGMLAITANAMQKSATGGGAFVAMAAAVALMAISLKMLSGIDAGALWVSVGVIGALLGIMVIVGALGGKVAPGLLAFSGALAILSIAMIVAAASVVVLAIGIGLMGPALAVLAGGLIAFGAAADGIMKAIGPLMAVGGAFIIFGIGAAVAGVGLALLGAGLIVLGAGLALIGATGIIGATALAATIFNITKLGDQMPAILGIAATLLVLGAAAVLLGVGLLAIGAGALMFVGAVSSLVLLGPAATLAITTLLAAIIATIPALMSAIAVGLVQFAQILNASIPIFVQAGVNLIRGLINGAISLMPDVANLINALIATILNILVTSIPRIVDAGMKILIGFVEGISNNIGQLVTAVSNLIVNFLNGITNNLPRIIRAGTNLIIAFIRGIGDAGTDIINAAAETIIKFLNGIADTIRTKGPEFRQAGGNIARAIVDGLTSGISEAATDAINAASKMAGDAVQAVKNLLGIKSPSRVMRGIGEFFGMGFNNGIGSMISSVASSAQRMGSASVNAVQNSLTSLADIAEANMDTTPVIRPVMDLTDIQKGSSALGAMLPTARIGIDANLNKATQLNTSYQATRQALGVDSGSVTNIEFNQTNNSPKSLDTIEIYRRTNNQISQLKEAS